MWKSRRGKGDSTKQPQATTFTRQGTRGELKKERKKKPRKNPAKHILEDLGIKEKVFLTVMN